MLDYLLNWAYQHDECLPEARRALRVWREARGWFDHPDAADFREHDEIVLAAKEDR